MPKALIPMSPLRCRRQVRRNTLPRSSFGAGLAGVDGPRAAVKGKEDFLEARFVADEIHDSGSAESFHQGFKASLDDAPTPVVLDLDAVDTLGRLDRGQRDRSREFDFHLVDANPVHLTELRLLP